MKRSKNKKIMAALSGGVDSSVAAFLLKKRFPTAEIVGVTMRLWKPSADDKKRAGGCCSLADISDAARVCRALGLKHYVFNYSDIFRDKVAIPFLQSYLGGFTPNPCVVCNEVIKFGVLIERSRALGFDCLATGHYARIFSNSSGKNFLIRKAVDIKKDQSYFLWRVSPKVLPNVIFPVGDYTKEEIRRIAKDAKLPIADKKESYDVCFVGGDYRNFISSYTEEIKKSAILSGKKSRGEIVDKDGRILGYHDGIYKFTVGQRSGLGVAARERLYVVKIETDINRVVVGTREDALVKKFRLKNCILHPPYEKFFTDKEPARGQKVFDVKIRYLSPAYKSLVRKCSGDLMEPSGLSLEVEIKGDAVFGVTPGQSAVFYDGDLVAGGGVIAD